MLDRLSPALTLDNPAVQAARARWFSGEKHRTNVKNRFDFDDWFAYFNDTSVRHLSTAKVARISPQGVSYHYRRYFRPLFGGKDGLERRRQFILERRLKKLAEAEKGLLNRRLKRIVVRARAAGCSIEAIPYYKNGLPMGTVDDDALLINGHRCQVHQQAKQNAVKITQRELAISKMVVVHTHFAGCSEHTFVIPVRVLYRHYFLGRRRPRGLCQPHIPRDRSHMARFPFDWWRYEDAWQLLSPAPISAV